MNGQVLRGELTGLRAQTDHDFEVSEACRNCDNCDAGRSRPVVPTGLFSPGERVTHHQWGPGLVLDAEADRLTVLFDDYGCRELATQVVSGRHLLDPA
jgi:ATP-dependent DNA helicase RecQ